MAGRSSTLIASFDVLVTGASAYGAGNCLGALLTLDLVSLYRTLLPGVVRDAPSYRGSIWSLGLIDMSKQDVSTDVFIFSAKPTTSTITDKSNFVLTAADKMKVLAAVNIPATAYRDASAASIGYLQGINVPYLADANNCVYLAMVTRGTPTYATAADVGLRVGLFMD